MRICRYTEFVSLPFYSTQSGIFHIFDMLVRKTIPTAETPTSDSLKLTQATVYGHNNERGRVGKIYTPHLHWLS